MVTFTCIFVAVTLILTGLATLFLTMSLLSDEWEYIHYKTEVVERITQSKNLSLEWLEGPVARIDCVPSESGNGSTVIYLVPAFGGVNKLCIYVTDSVRKRMAEDGHKFENCISYLSKEKVISRDSWLDRMRNLAMSCAIVSLILLGCSAPLGILGLLKKQISTIMVTGVMYSLAAIFGIFNLVFMRFKRVKSDGFYTSTILDKGVPEEYMRSRTFSKGWPVSLEWAGLSICVIASIFWLLLAKIFRFLILSPTLS